MTGGTRITFNSLNGAEWAAISRILRAVQEKAGSSHAEEEAIFESEKFLQIKLPD